MEITTIIKERRMKLNLTQTDLAEMSSVSLCTIKDIERGKGNPSLGIIQKICETLGLEIKLEIKKTVE